MNTQDNEFFFSHLKSMKALEATFSQFVKEFELMRPALVRFENELRSAEAQVKAKQEELAQVCREIKEQKILASESTVRVRDELNKRHVELVARESKVKAIEVAAQEQLNKANALLAAAEMKTKRKVNVEA